MGNRKKYIILASGLVGIIVVFALAYLVVTNNFDFRFNAGSYKLNAAFINGSTTFSVTQLETYKIKLTDSSGKQIKGQFVIDSIYCPPGVNKTKFPNPETVPATALNSHLGKCVRSINDFTNWTQSDGIIAVDLGKSAIDWRPSDIGTYYSKLYEKNNPAETSNEITLKITKLNMLDYWTMDPSNYYIFSAKNSAVNQSGMIYVDYVTKQKVCSEDSSNTLVWRAYGSNKYMYWNPVYSDRSDVDPKNVRPGITNLPAKDQFLYLGSNYSKTTFDGSKITSSTPLEQQYVSFNSWTSYLPSKSITNSTFSQLANGQNVSTNLKLFDEAQNYNSAYGNPPFTTFNVVSELKDANNVSLGKGTSLIYMPVLLDLNEEYNSDRTDFFSNDSTNPNTCSKINKKSPTGSTFITMHSISYIPFKNAKYGYGVVISLKEVYKDWNDPKCNPNNANIQTFKAGICTNALREDYYINKGVGLTAMKTGQFGTSGFHSSPLFKNCKDDPDCLSSVGTGYTPNKKKEIQNPELTVDLVNLGKKSTATSTSSGKNLLLSAGGDNFDNQTDPVLSSKTVKSANTASFLFNVNASSIGNDSLDYFQVIVDEKGGYAPVCGNAFSSNSNGGVRLMFNTKPWKLGNNTLSQTVSQSNIYLYNPSKVAYTGGYNSFTNASNSYGWNNLGAAPQSSVYTLSNGFKITNLKYTLSGGIWVISFDVTSPVAVSGLNSYFAYKKSAEKNAGHLPTTHDINVFNCNGDLINKIVYPN